MRKRNGVDSHLFCVAAIAVSVLVSAGPAFGQFIVQPMVMDVLAMRGQKVKLALDIQSLDPNAIHTVTLSLIELTQNEDGTWRVIEPNSEFDTSTLSSCKEWISLTHKSVDIVPNGRAHVGVIVGVPRRSRGFYGAAILASLQPRPDPGGDIVVVLRFLIPILLEVQGRPMRHKIELNDVGLESVGPRGDNPGTAHVLMNIENAGGTISRLKAFTRVRGFRDGHWREITTAEFKDVRITPGAKFKLRSDMGRSLPPGKYRLSGVLYVDGRRAKRIGKEIDHAGNPSVTKLATDAPLDLRPSDASISSRPGTVRRAIIGVYNASDETVNVQTALALPPALRGVAFGDLIGEDLDCTGWLKVEPESFTVRSRAQQNIRITATMPNSGAIHPCYYALLGLHSTYSDGDRAGVTTANISVVNENISSEPSVYGMTLRPALKEGSEYYVVARFGNFGRIHFTPVRCRAAVVGPTNVPLARTSLSSRKSGPMLPLEARDFSGVIDFSNLPAGTYPLAAVLEYAPGEELIKQIAIRVLVQGGRKVIEVIQLGESGEKIEVKW